MTSFEGKDSARGEALTREEEAKEGMMTGGGEETRLRRVDVAGGGDPTGEEEVGIFVGLGELLVAPVSADMEGIEEADRPEGA